MQVFRDLDVCFRSSKTIILETLNLLSANAFNLVQSKMLSFGKELKTESKTRKVKVNIWHSNENENILHIVCLNEILHEFEIGSCQVKNMVTRSNLTNAVEATFQV